MFTGVGRPIREPFRLHQGIKATRTPATAAPTVMTTRNTAVAAVLSVKKDKLYTYFIRYSLSLQNVTV